jgi:23S rRNA pseudouridine1911/1915/1917 synthase
MSTPSPPLRPSPAIDHPDREWTVPPELHARPLDGVVRTLSAVSWSEARRLIETGKLRVGGEVVTSPVRKVRAGDRISLHRRAPRLRTARVQQLEAGLVVYVDPTLVVVDKPAGVSTVPFGDEDPGELTLDALVREVLARRDALRGRAPLGVVQRLDKATSGLLVFSRTLAAKKHLGQQLRVRSVHRRYLAIAHGDVPSGTIRSYLVEDRGDRLRGSAHEGRREGQLAVTHVERVERLAGATLVACRLETGRTHQIRIHLAEQGHPLVGEAVYVRDFAGALIPAPRLMLHAAELGFEHPSNGRAMRFEAPPPADFQETLARLRR